MLYPYFSNKVLFSNESRFGELGDVDFRVLSLVLH